MRISPRELIFSFKELGNVSQVAKMFGVSRMTVYRWVKRSKTGYEIFSTEFPKTLISKWQGHETEKHHRAWGYLQIDTKHVTPELSGPPFTVYEYAAIDIVSRYKVAVLLPEIDSESASLALEFFLKWFPFKVLYVQNTALTIILFTRILLMRMRSLKEVLELIKMSSIIGWKRSQNTSEN